MLVQLLEGRIEVDSVLGKGSTFTLRVPLYPVRVGEVESGELRVESSVQHDSAAPYSAANSQFSTLHSPLINLLLIDDDRIQLTLTAAMLAQSGITSVTCLQLDELLEALRTDTFDVLLTDVQMPAMNGFDLLRLLRASNIPQAKTIPVIAVTARSDMKREEFLQHGFAGSLHKPFTVNELLAEIGVLQADIATVDAAPSSTLNFSALTAFSGDDPDAAKSILESFVTETRLNVDRLRQALETEDTDGIAAMGHKMLPLFTLLGANDLVTLLKELEASRGVPFDEKIKEKSFAALNLIEDILEQAFLFISSA
jgi:DNA-binding response OmpR family regulator